MRKRTKRTLTKGLKRVTSSLLIASVMAASVSIPAFANPELTIDDAHDGFMFSKTYTIGSSNYLVAAYNSPDGTKITGDVLLSSGALIRETMIWENDFGVKEFPYNSVYHYNGYILAPFTIKDIIILNSTDEKYMSMYFLSTEGKLYTFDGKSFISVINEQFIYFDNFFGISTDHSLYFVDPLGYGNMKIEDDIKSFSIIKNDVSFVPKSANDIGNDEIMSNDTEREESALITAKSDFLIKVTKLDNSEKYISSDSITVDRYDANNNVNIIDADNEQPVFIMSKDNTSNASAVINMTMPVENIIGNFEVLANNGHSITYSGMSESGGIYTGTIDGIHHYAITASNNNGKGIITITSDTTDDVFTLDNSKIITEDFSIYFSKTSSAVSFVTLLTDSTNLKYISSATRPFEEGYEIIGIGGNAKPVLINKLTHGSFEVSDELSFTQNAYDNCITFNYSTDNYILDFNKDIAYIYDTISSAASTDTITGDIFTIPGYLNVAFDENTHLATFTLFDTGNKMTVDYGGVINNTDSYRNFMNDVESEWESNRNIIYSNTGNYTIDKVFENTLQSAVMKINKIKLSGGTEFNLKSLKENQLGTIFYGEQIPESFIETVKVDDATYGLTSNNEVYKISEKNNNYFVETIATNAVKLSYNGFLTKDNEVLSYGNQTVLKTGVYTISDNVYKTASTYYYFDSDEEFVFNRAGYDNINATRVVTTNNLARYNISYDENHATVYNSNNEIIANNTTIDFYENGLYKIKLVNDFNEEFEYSIFVNNIGDTSLEGPTLGVIEDTIYATSDYKIQYSTDQVTWTTYTTEFALNGNTYYFRTVDETNNKTSNIYSAYINNSELVVEDVTVQALSPEKFAGLGYVAGDSMIAFDQYGGINSIDIEEGAYSGQIITYYDYDGTTYTFTPSKGFTYGYAYDTFNVESPVAAFLNNKYEYLVGETGNVVRIIRDKGSYFDSIAQIYVDDIDLMFTYEGIAKEIVGNNIILTDDTVIHTNDCEDLGLSVDNLTYYKNYNKINEDYIDIYTEYGDTYFNGGNTIQYTFNFGDTENHIISLNGSENSGFSFEESIEVYDSENNLINFTVDNNGFLVSDKITNGTYTFKFIYDTYFYQIDTYQYEYTDNVSTDDIVSVKYTDAGYKAMDKDGYVYSYLANNHMVLDYNYTQLTDSINKVGYTLKDTNWINEPVAVIFSNLSDYNAENIKDEPFNSSTNTYNGISCPEAVIELPNGIREDNEPYMQIINTNREYTLKGSENTKNKSGMPFTIATDLEANTGHVITFEYKTSVDMDYSLYGEFRYSTDDKPYNGDYIYPSLTFEDTVTNSTWSGSRFKGIADHWIKVTATLPSSSDVRSLALSLTTSADGTIDVASFTLDGTPLNTVSSYVAEKEAAINTYEISLEAFQNATKEDAAYIIEDENGNVIDTMYNTNFVRQATLTNGIYTIKMLNNDDAVIASTKMRILNVDTVKPTISYNSTTSEFVFEAEDVAGIGNNANSGISGVEGIYYSTNALADVSTYTKFSKKIKYDANQISDKTETDDLITLNTNIIYVYSKDNAGNISDIQTVDLSDFNRQPTTLYPTIEYTNGSSTLKYYANDDTNNTSFNYNIKLHDESVYSTGYTKTVTTDSYIDLKATKTGFYDGLDTINVIVIKTNAPIISDVTDKKYVDITPGVAEHGTVDKIYVKIDNGSYIEKTPDASGKIRVEVPSGDHVIKAYQTVIGEDANNTVITSDTTTKNVHVNESIVLHPEITYENGKTIIDFYANDDTDNTDYTYSYTIDDTTTDDSHRTETNEDIIITIEAKKPGYNDESETLDIKVIKTEAPVISDVIENTNYVTVTKGQTTNCVYKEMYIKIDDGNWINFTNASNTIVVPKGTHLITSYQKVTFTDWQGNVQTMNSAESSKYVTVDTDFEITITPSYTYENGKTTVTFYGDEDKNHNDPLYSYEYNATGANTEGYTYSTTEDKRVTIIVHKDVDGVICSRADNVTLKVIKTEKPTIDVLSDNEAFVMFGEVKNATVDKLYIKIDNGEWIEYSEETKINIPSGIHTIYAYQTVKTTLTGQNIHLKSEVAVKEVTNNTVQTNDSTNKGLIIGILVGSSIIIFSMTLLYHKKKESQE